MPVEIFVDNNFYDYSGVNPGEVIIYTTPSYVVEWLGDANPEALAKVSKLTFKGNSRLMDFIVQANLRESGSLLSTNIEVFSSVQCDLFPGVILHGEV